MSDIASLAKRPIPRIRPTSGWKSVSIDECGEPLVALSCHASPRIFAAPQYYRRGVPTAIEEIFLRAGVLERLVRAASLLSDEYGLVVWDAWRPVSVQQALFDEEYRKVRERSPFLSIEEAAERTETYVSLPSTVDSHPSPHYTGGAIDLGLADSSGRALFAGTEFDAFDERSRTRSLEDRLQAGVRLTASEEEALRYRRILFHVMSGAGFTNYWEEWWHFDYGNQFWASVTSRAAIYGGIEPQGYRATT